MLVCYYNLLGFNQFFPFFPFSTCLYSVIFMMRNDNTCAVERPTGGGKFKIHKSGCIFKPTLIQNLMLVLLPAEVYYNHRHNAKMVFF